MFLYRKGLAGNLCYVGTFIILTLILFQEAKAQNKVLIIGIDGCRPDALLEADTENLDGLWKNGAYSFQTKTDALSSSGICWTGMLTGVWHDKHGVVSNAYNNPNTEEFPHFFKRIKEEKPDLKAYSVVNWNPIHNILPESQAEGIKHKIFDSWVASAGNKILKKEDTDVLFLQFDNVDHAGHSTGFSKENKKYLKAIEKTDNKIGRLLRTIEKRKNYKKENWLILVSTDHGGSGLEHGKDIPEHTTIFYIASGEDTKKGEIEKQVNVIDIAVTALQHVGIEIKEEWKLDGKVSGLKQ